MKKKFPVISLLTLTAIVILCLACSPMMTKDPLYMDLAHCNEAPAQPAVPLRYGHDGPGYLFHDLVRRQNFSHGGFSCSLDIHDAGSSCGECERLCFRQD